MELESCHPLTRYTHGLLRRLVVWVALFTVSLSAWADAPGGILEQPGTAMLRPPLTPAQIQAFLPARGKFTFPAPYNTQAVRLTNASDCGGADCLWYVGYSYWRNMNNHVGSDTMYIFLGLDRSRGGGGPTLFSYNKVTEEVRNLGPLFDATNPLSWTTGEGWYFSATQPTQLYLNDGPRMLRYDVLSKQLQPIYDVTSHFGPGYEIWQMHSSDDDRVHSATLRNASTHEMLGCVIYHEDSAQFQYFPKVGDFDECNLDRSGRWAISLENTQGPAYGLDMRVFDLSTGRERRVLDQNGAVGHADMGYGYVIGSDNWNALPNAILSWDFTQDPLVGQPVFYNTDWSAPAANHISHTNARPGVPMAQQYACGSNASPLNVAWANEIVCFRLDGSFTTLVVAPVMTDMTSAVGGDDYAKEPKGNLDVTGQYFLWTSNTGGSRVDAYIVKVPAQQLGGGGSGVVDRTAPTVTMISPASGSTISSSAVVSANASDNVGVVGVQFKLDGINLGAEVTAPPYSITWNASSAAAGNHSLTAVARDAAGNSTVSLPVVVARTGGITLPIISGMTASTITASAASIAWTTDMASDTQVEYGTTSTYGSLSTLNPALVTAHSANLSGLTMNTLYHYRVRSRDATGNLAQSNDATFITLADTTASDPQPITWADSVNVTVSGKALTKTGGCDGCEDASSISQQQIPAGDGYLQFSVTETSLIRFVGLSNAGTGTSAAEIPFAFRLGSGYATVYEKGAYRADTPITIGDVLRIAVKSGAVQYAKNGVVFYTSNAKPVYPLQVKAALLNLGSTVNNAVISGTAAATSGPRNATWTSAVNATASGNSLTKTSGCDGCEDAGAVSQQQITMGDGYLEVSVAETRLLRFVGLNNTDTGTSAAEIPFAFGLGAGYAEVRENGVYRADTPIAIGDVLRIAVKSGVVQYVKNGVVFYTSGAKPVYPLRADTALLNLGSAVNNAVIGVP